MTTHPLLYRIIKRAEDYNRQLDKLRDTIVHSNYESMALHPRFKEYEQLAKLASEATIAADFAEKEWQSLTVEEQNAMLTPSRIV